MKYVWQGENMARQVEKKHFELLKSYNKER